MSADENVVHVPDDVIAEIREKLKTELSPDSGYKLYVCRERLDLDPEESIEAHRMLTNNPSRIPIMIRNSEGKIFIIGRNQEGGLGINELQDKDQVLSTLFNDRAGFADGVHPEIDFDFDLYEVGNQIGDRDRRDEIYKIIHENNAHTPLHHLSHFPKDVSEDPKKKEEMTKKMKDFLESSQFKEFIKDFTELYISFEQQDIDSFGTSKLTERAKN